MVTYLGPQDWLVGVVCLEGEVPNNEEALATFRYHHHHQSSYCHLPILLYHLRCPLALPLRYRHQGDDLCPLTRLCFGGVSIDSVVGWLKLPDTFSVSIASVVDGLGCGLSVATPTADGGCLATTREAEGQRLSDCREH